MPPSTLTESRVESRPGALSDTPPLAEPVAGPFAAPSAPCCDQAPTPLLCGQSESAFFDVMPVGVVQADALDNIFYVNPEFFQLTECTLEDLGYMNFQDVLSIFCLGLPLDGPEIQCPENKWHAMEKYIRRSDGCNAWVRIHVSTLRRPDGSLCRQLLVEDVTRYKDLIDLLLNRKKRYQSIVERRPDPVCCFLPDWTLTFVNKPFCRWFHRDRGDILGEDFLSLLPLHERERCTRAVESITPEEPMVEFECRMEDGERPVWFRWVVQGFFYKTGYIKDYQAFGIDITEQKIMVSGIAHDINNPNNFIMLNLPLVLDLWSRVAPLLLEPGPRKAAIPGGLSVEDVLEHVPQLLLGAMEGSRRIKELVNELRAVSRQNMESGFELLSLEDVVRSATFFMRKTLEKHTRHFSVQVEPHLPRVRGRRQRLEQVLINLLHNACLALQSPEQAIALHVSRAPDGGVLLAVEDQGEGIAPEDLPRVTDPFYSTRRERGGTGLGLSLSLSIAREHGGSLDVASTPGVGTVVTVSLPGSAAESATA